ncbi:MAG: tripartite tricarboxylate transporter TctB family protein [Rhodospirillales bacterium]
MAENTQAGNVTPPPSARTDLITAAVFLAFGIAVVVLALNMPTFTDSGGTGLTAPGIVPGFHGTVIALLAIAFALRSIYRGALKPGGGQPVGFEDLPKISLTRLAITAALGMTFAVGLVTRVPFWLAVFLFVASFIVIFEWQPGMATALRVRRIVTGLLVAAGMAAFVVAVFQEIFLVRLP